MGNLFICVYLFVCPGAPSLWLITMGPSLARACRANLRPPPARAVPSTAVDGMARLCVVCPLG
eukprot:9368936-Pyramimonas_sp.AAC.1